MALSIDHSRAAHVIEVADRVLREWNSVDAATLLAALLDHPPTHTAERGPSSTSLRDVVAASVRGGSDKAEGVPGIDLIGVPGELVLETLSAGDLIAFLSREAEAFDALAVVTRVPAVPRSELAGLGHVPIGSARGFYAPVVAAGVLPMPSTHERAMLIAAPNGRLPSDMFVFRLGQPSVVPQPDEQARPDSHQPSTSHRIAVTADWQLEASDVGDGELFVPDRPATKSDEGQLPPLPDALTVGDSLDEAAGLSLATGCYRLRYEPDGRHGRGRFEGTLRVERGRERATISGDLYSSVAAPGVRPRPAAGIPIFPRDRYAGYVRVARVSPQSKGKVRLTFEFFRYDARRRSWSSPSSRTVDLPRAHGAGAASRFTGSVRNATGRVIGRMTLDWVSPMLRRATVEIDRVAASEAPLSDGTTNDWRSVFRSVGWDVTALESDQSVREPGKENWSNRELHAALLRHRRGGASLDTEWRYHLLCVRRLDFTSRGVMYDVGGTDSNSMPREGAAIASHWMIPSGSDRRACGRSWGGVAGRRFGDAPAPYFRTAIHEVSHAMGLGHPSSGSGTHIMQGTDAIVCNSSAASPFPANISWRHSAADQKRLKHLPDHWVRPGAHSVHFSRGSSTYSGAPGPDQAPIQSRDLELTVRPLLDQIPLGAPVRVELSLTNHGDEGVVAPASLGFKHGTISGRVTGPAGETKSFRSILRCVDESHDVAILAPGDTICRSETLLRGAEGALFDSHGEYVIEVVARWHVDGVLHESTGSSTVHVSQSLNRDHEAAARRILDTEDVLLVLALGGDHLSDGIGAVQVALENPVLRPHYAFVEAKRLAQSFFDRQGDAVAAAALLDEATVLSDSEVSRATELGLMATRDPLALPAADE